MADNNEERAHTKTLQDILNMTIKLSDSELQEFKESEISDERKEFLKSAIEHALENDDSKKLVMFTRKLLEYKTGDILSEDQLTEAANVFEGLNFLLEGMDVAKDFNSLGGLKHSVSLLKMNYSSLQWRAADIIANCVQNNPKCQYSAIEEKGFETLLHLLQQTDVDIVCVKCLYALSSLLGGNDVAEKLFIDLKGVDVVVKFISDSNPKIRLKSAFLLRKIIWSETAKFVTNKSEITSQLITLLKMEFDDSHEVIADVLLNLVKIDENSLNEFKNDKDDIRDLFTSRKEELFAKNAEKYEELIEIYEKLLQLL